MTENNQWKEEFPELSQSVMGDILKNYNNDKKKMENALRSMNEDVQKEKEKKYNELKELFPLLSENIIKQTLQENNWNVDASIAPLFNKTEQLKKKQIEEKKKIEEEEKKKFYEQNKIQSIKQLREIFHSISPEKIQEILDENEGDIQETSNKLADIVSEQNKLKELDMKKKEEEEKKMLDQKKMNELKIQALLGKFENLSEDQIKKVLESNSWDIKISFNKLLTISGEQKKKQLKIMFPIFSEEEIESILLSNNFDFVKASEILSQLKLKKEKEQEIENKRKESVNITQIRKKFLEKSVILVKELENEIEASQIQMKQEEEKFIEEQKKAINQSFKQELEHIIACQARVGTCPGMNPPPLPKEIDVILGKKQKLPPPIIEEEIKMQPVLVLPKEPPVKIEKNDNNNKEKIIIKLDLESNIYDSGNTINVHWECLEGQTTSYDWIGLFPIDQPNKQYYTYQWRGKDEKKGIVSFVAPSNFGEYEFRYFPNGSYQHISISNRIKIGPQFELFAKLDSENNKIRVTWKQISGNSYSRAWVGLYEKTQSNNKQFITWEYASGKPTNEILFELPIKPQIYECRLFVNSYVDIAKSNPITIEGEDSISATYENKIITVTVNIVTVDPYYDTCWVGIYFTKETDNRQWRRYKYFTERKKEIKFKAPSTPGEYEVRLFAHKSYEPMLKSNSFIIP